MNKIIFYVCLSMCIWSGGLLCTDQPDAVISNLAINIKCNPVQEISNIKQQAYSSTVKKPIQEIQKVPTEQIEIQVQENEGGIAPSFKLKIAVVAAAVVGFCYTNAEHVVNIATKIKRVVR